MNYKVTDRYLLRDYAITDQTRDNLRALLKAANEHLNPALLHFKEGDLVSIIVEVRRPQAECEHIWGGEYSNRPYCLKCGVFQ